MTGCARRPTPLQSPDYHSSHLKKDFAMTRILTATFVLTLLAACVEDDNFVYESDISEANINTECPVDVSEADRANYPACQ